MGAIETKVKAATVGAGTGAAVGYAVADWLCWLLDEKIITPGVAGDLPGPVTALVTTGLMAAVSAVVAFAAGYRAKHTPRHAAEGRP